MAPKTAAKGAPPPASSKPSVLDLTFPLWTDAPSGDKESADKYEDPAGELLPPETEAFLDTWKRPEDLVQNLSDVPMLRLKPGTAAAPVDAKGRTLKPCTPCLHARSAVTCHAPLSGPLGRMYPWNDRFHVPVLCHAAAKGAPPVPASRTHEGRLFPGHKSFEWLKSVFDAVISAQKKLPPGGYLWELIHPKDKDGAPMKSPNGKYKVKLCIMVRG